MASTMTTNRDSGSATPEQNSEYEEVNNGSVLEIDKVEDDADCCSEITPHNTLQIPLSLQEALVVVPSSTDPEQQQQQYVSVEINGLTAMVAVPDNNKDSRKVSAEEYLSIANAIKLRELKRPRPVETVVRRSTIQEVAEASKGIDLTILVEPSKFKGSSINAQLLLLDQDGNVDYKRWNSIDGFVVYLHQLYIRKSDVDIVMDTVNRVAKSKKILTYTTEKRRTLKQQTSEWIRLSFYAGCGKNMLRSVDHAMGTFSGAALFYPEVAAVRICKIDYRWQIDLAARITDLTRQEAIISEGIVASQLETSLKFGGSNIMPCGVFSGPRTAPIFMRMAPFQHLTLDHYFKDANVSYGDAIHAKAIGDKTGLVDVKPVLEHQIAKSNQIQYGSWPDGRLFFRLATDNFEMPLFRSQIRNGLSKLTVEYKLTGFEIGVNGAIQFYCIACGERTEVDVFFVLRIKADGTPIFGCIRPLHSSCAESSIKRTRCFPALDIEGTQGTPRLEGIKNVEIHVIKQFDPLPKWYEVTKPIYANYKTKSCLFKGCTRTFQNVEDLDEHMCEEIRSIGYCDIIGCGSTMAAPLLNSQSRARQTYKLENHIHCHTGHHAHICTCGEAYITTYDLEAHRMDCSDNPLGERGIPWQSFEDEIVKNTTTYDEAKERLPGRNRNGYMCRKYVLKNRGESVQQVRGFYEEWQPWEDEIVKTTKGWTTAKDSLPHRTEYGYSKRKSALKKSLGKESVVSVHDQVAWTPADDQQVLGSGCEFRFNNAYSDTSPDFQSRRTLYAYRQRKGALNKMLDDGKLSEEQKPQKFGHTQGSWRHWEDREVLSTSGFAKCSKMLRDRRSSKVYGNRKHTLQQMIKGGNLPERSNPNFKPSLVISTKKVISEVIDSEGAGSNLEKDKKRQKLSRENASLLKPVGLAATQNSGAASKQTDTPRQKQSLTEAAPIPKGRQEPAREKKGSIDATPSTIQRQGTDAANESSTGQSLPSMLHNHGAEADVSASNPSAIMDRDLYEWCRENLSSAVSSDLESFQIFIQTLLSFPHDPNLIADSVHSLTTQLDEHLFAKEFLHRKNLTRAANGFQNTP